jgi:hypothetical protein
MSPSDVPTLDQLEKEKQSLLRDLRALEAPLHQAISQEKSALNAKLHQIKSKKPNLIEEIINLAIKILGLTDLKATLEKNEMLRKKQKLLEEYRDNVQKHMLRYKIQNIQNNEPREKLSLQIQTIDRTIHFLEKQKTLREKYYSKETEQPSVSLPPTRKPAQPIIDRYHHLPETQDISKSSSLTSSSDPKLPPKPPKNPIKKRNKS